jgi:6-phosphogluconolactonase (cycloisomerase 2 family)
MWIVICSTAVHAAPLWQQIDVLRNGENGLTSIDGVYDFAFSPDGAYAYAAAYNSSAVTVFARNQATGLLSPVQVLQNNVGGVKDIGATRALRMTPDGKQVYAASYSDHAVAIFDRNAATGQLTFNTSYEYPATNGLLAANAMNISGDGRYVYISSEANDSLSTYARDATTGALTFVQFLKDGVVPITTLDTIRSFTISADDRFLYAPARDDDDITQFVRDPATGALTSVQQITGGSNFSGPTHITFSPDGRHAYVASQFSDSLSLFDVDSLTGNLTYRLTYHDNQNGFNLLNHAEDIVITADGQFVAVSATIDNALTIFRRDAVSGELTVFQEFRDGVNGIDGLFRARELFLSPDGRFLYVMGPEEPSIAIFAVPEPSSAALAALAAAGALLAARGRRRRTSR